MGSSRPEQHSDQRREPSWIVQAIVTALINQLAPSVLTVLSTVLILIKAGIVNRDRLDLGIILVAVAVATGISILSFVAGIRYTMRMLIGALASIFSRAERERQEKHWWTRLIGLIEVAVLRLAFLPEWLAEKRDAGDAIGWRLPDTYFKAKDVESRKE
jgi:hypothetical protein